MTAGSLNDAGFTFPGLTDANGDWLTPAGVKAQNNANGDRGAYSDLFDTVFGFAGGPAALAASESGAVKVDKDRVRGGFIGAQLGAVGTAAEAAAGDDPKAVAAGVQADIAAGGAAATVATLGAAAPATVAAVEGVSAGEAAADAGTVAVTDAAAEGTAETAALGGQVGGSAGTAALGGQVGGSAETAALGGQVGGSAVTPVTSAGADASTVPTVSPVAEPETNSSLNALGDRTSLYDPKLIPDIDIKPGMVSKETLQGDSQIGDAASRSLSSRVVGSIRDTGLTTAQSSGLGIINSGNRPAEQTPLVNTPETPITTPKAEVAPQSASISGTSSNSQFESIFGKSPTDMMMSPTFGKIEEPPLAPPPQLLKPPPMLRPPPAEYPAPMMSDKRNKTNITNADRSIHNFLNQIYGRI